MGNSEGRKMIEKLEPYTLPRVEAAEYIGVSVRRFCELLAGDLEFPKPIQLGGPRSSRWIRVELEAYLASRPRVTRDEPEQLAQARRNRDGQGE